MPLGPVATRDKHHTLPDVEAGADPMVDAWGRLGSAEVAGAAVRKARIAASSACLGTAGLLILVLLVLLRTAAPAAAGDAVSAIHEHRRLVTLCRHEGRCASEMKRWLAFVDRHRDGPVNGVLLDVADGFVDTATYRRDGPGEGWKTPLALFTIGGDCEDFSLAKVLLLADIGLDPADLSVIVYPPLDSQPAHAVASVQLDGSTYVLDNDGRPAAMPLEWSQYGPRSPLWRVTLSQLAGKDFVEGRLEGRFNQELARLSGTGAICGERP